MICQAVDAGLCDSLEYTAGHEEAKTVGTARWKAIGREDGTSHQALAQVKHHEDNLRRQGEVCNESGDLWLDKEDEGLMSVGFGLENDWRTCQVVAAFIRSLLGSQLLGSVHPVGRKVFNLVLNRDTLWVLPVVQGLGLVVQWLEGMAKHVRVQRFVLRWMVVVCEREGEGEIRTQVKYSSATDSNQRDDARRMNSRPLLLRGGVAGLPFVIFCSH